MDSKRFQPLFIIVWFVKLTNSLCSKIQNGDAKAMDIAIRYELMTGATLHGTHLQENKDAVKIVNHVITRQEAEILGQGNRARIKTNYHNYTDRKFKTLFNKQACIIQTST